MINTILSLPVGLGALVVVMLTLLLAFAPYMFMRRLLLGRSDPPEKDLANSIVVRVSALHSLILALVFAQELVNLRDINIAAIRESVMVNDIFFDLGRYGDPEITAAIRDSIALYAHLVLFQEWDALAQTGRLLPEAWQAWESAYRGILALSPQTPSQKALADILLSDIRDISGLRRIRENAGLTGVPGLFLAAAMLGVVMTGAAFYTHRPSGQSFFLIGIFAGYTGLIIYFVLAFAHPYQTPGKANPVGFQQIYDGPLGDWHKGMR